MNKLQVSALAAIATSILVACGGGKSSSDSTSNTSGPVKLTGVVSTGSPTVNPLTTTNKVTAKCLNGSGGTTQSVVNVLADGSYEVTLADSSLPCVLQVDTPQKMASLAQGTGPGTAVANITPVTTLVVAKVAGKDPVQFFAEFGSGTAAVITSENVNAAITIVRDVVAKAGVSLTGVVNVFTDTVDKNASLASAADSYDLAVAKLADTIRSAGITLETVSLDVSTLSSSSSGSNAVAATSSGVASLPADRLLKPAAPTCPALRSGDYVSIDLAPDTTVATGAAPVDSIAYFTVDAATTPIQVFDVGGSITAGTLDPVSGDPCRFISTNGNREFVIAQSGVLVGRFTQDGGLTYRAAIGIPRQTLTLADLAGTWNVLSYHRNGGTSGTPFSPNSGTADVDALGTVSNSQCFDDPIFPATGIVCTPGTGANPTITPNADGGFDVADPPPPCRQ
ncbi:MAG: hypothetical protein IPG93_19245 [Burkholderiales bacterium]|nr:hypothetical protein [Burkholderiales bacterium]